MIQRHPLFSIALSFAFFVLPPVYARETNPIVLAADAWCPVNCGPDDAHPGFMVDLARAIFGNAGYEVEYRLMPWSRALREARSGAIDGVLGAFAGDAPDFVFPAAPLLVISPSDLFARNDFDWTFRGIPSLAEVRLGAIQDYGYGDELNAYLLDPANKGAVDVIHGQRAIERNLAKLLSGRIDVVVETQGVFLHAARKMDATDRVKFVGRVAPPENCTVAFSPASSNSAYLAKLFSDGVEDMRRTGALMSLLASYGFADPVPPPP